MLPVAPPGGASSYVPAIPLPTRAYVPPNDHVLLALPPTAASASVLRALRSEGVSVSPVGDGIGVLDAIRTRDPALLVLDVDLPGPDQSAVLAAVQAEAPNVPVIAVTPRERRATLLDSCAATGTTTYCARSPSTSWKRGSGCGCGWVSRSRRPCSARARSWSTPSTTR